MLTAAGERLDYERFLADARFARLTAYILNIYRDRKIRPEPFVPKEFMPGYSREKPKEQTAEEQLEMVKLAHKTFKKAGKAGTVK